MLSNVLVVGRLRTGLEGVVDALENTDITFYTATGLDEVQTAMTDAAIDTVFIGAGLDLNTRLAIIRHIVETSNTTTVHMKDRESGPAGALPFINRVLTGLRSES